jgi:hypothetical protein
LGTPSVRQSPRTAAPVHQAWLPSWLPWVIFGNASVVDVPVRERPPHLRCLPNPAWIRWQWRACGGNRNYGWSRASPLAALQTTHSPPQTSKPTAIQNPASVTTRCRLIARPFDVSAYRQLVARATGAQLGVSLQVTRNKTARGQELDDRAASVGLVEPRQPVVVVRAPGRRDRGTDVVKPAHRPRRPEHWRPLARHAGISSDLAEVGCAAHETPAPDRHERFAGPAVDVLVVAEL